MTIAESYTISVIKPKAATNLITNPSFETGVTGWTTGGTNTIATSAVQQRRGVYSCKCTYSDDDTYLSYGITLTATAYTASMDIYIPTNYDGTAITLKTSGFAGSTEVYGLADMTIRDKWQRVHCHITAVSGDLVGVLLLTEDGTNATATRFIYVDAVQIELGTVATTYFDGDMTGFIRNKQDYYWTGAEHASTSVRTKDAANGGELVNLGDYCKNINTYGLGIGPIQNVAIPLAKGGERFLYQQRLARFFDIEMIFKGLSGSTAQIGNLQKNRNDVINLLKPDRTAYDQPMVLRYQAYDTSDNPIGDPVNIKCQYVDGLNQAPINRFADRTRVTFRMSDRDFEADGDQGVELGYQTAVSNANYIIKRDADGDWSAMATGLNNTVRDIAKSKKTGEIFVCGTFTNAGGDATADYIAKWNGTSFVSITSTAANGFIYSMDFDASGNLYVCGNFTSIGGTAANYIAKWNGSSWSALSTGLDGTAWVVKVHSDGSVYVGGGFTQAGVGSANRIAKWNGSAWSTFGTGVALGTCYSINFDGNNNLYIGGNFTSVGGVTANYIAKWNGSAWSALGTGMDDEVWSIEFDNNGTMFVSGNFGTAGGTTALAIAVWNGTTWQPVGSGLSDGAGVGSVYKMKFDDDGNLLISGQFDKAGTVTLKDGHCSYKGGVYFTNDVELPGTGVSCFGLLVDNQNIYLGYNQSGTAYSATVTTPEIEGATTYPIIRVTGPGTLWQIKNYTTGRAIYFNGLTLLAGEKIVIDLTPGKVTMQSTFRGSVLSYVIKGSNLDFPLTPGENNLSAYLYGSTTAASKISATWKKRLHYLGDAT